MVKRMICLFLSMVMCFGVLVTFSACGGSALDRETPADDFEWESTDGGIKITGYKGSAETVVVPELIENKKVVTIDKKAFSGNLKIKALVLPKYVKSIGLTSTLGGCDNLTYLEMRAKDVYIGSYGTDHVSIQELFLPNVTEIDSGTFYGSLKGLKKINAPNCEKIRCSALRFPSNVEEVILKAQPVYASMQINITMDGYDDNGETIIKETCYIMNLICDASYTPRERSESELYIDYDAALTAQNMSKYICSVFDQDEIKVNGVTYKSTERFAIMDY